jgi:bifunctional DNase/RNase
MYKRVQFIALVPNYYSGAKHYTLYLFEKEEKVVLPVKVRNQEAIFYLTGKTPASEVLAHIYDTVGTLFSCCRAKLVSITLYNYQDGIFYTYLNVVLGQKHLEINARFSDAFVLAKKLKAPIYINHGVLEKRGIKVTKKVIRDALREG